MVDGKVTDQIEYPSAIEEGRDYVVAQANATLDDNKVTLTDELVTCREKGETIPAERRRRSSTWTWRRARSSVAASLIPFLEHDDANRALMGANMQRQAVPCRPEKPPSAPASSAPAAVTRHCRPGRRGGIVDYVDASRIVVRVNDDETAAGEVGVDIYNLVKYTRPTRTPTSTSVRW